MAKGLRQYPVNVALLFISVALAIMLVETFLRFIKLEPQKIVSQVIPLQQTGVKESWHTRSDDKVLIFEPVPNFQSERVPYRTNSTGFRDRDFVKDRSAAKRILILGDSVTFGVEIRDVNDTYPKVLERTFASNGEDVEVYNLGITGYNTVQEARLFEREGSAYHPDLVVVGYVVKNDESALYEVVDGKLIYYFEKYPYIPGVPYNKFFTEKLYSVRLINQSLIDLLDLKRISFLETEPYKAMVNAISGLSKNTNGKLLFVLFPLLTDDELTQERLFIKSLLDRQLLPYLDLYGAFDKVGRAKLRAQPTDIIHPNERGNEIAAREIFRFIKENNLL